MSQIPGKTLPHLDKRLVFGIRKIMETMHEVVEGLKSFIFNHQRLALHEVEALERA